MKTHWVVIILVNGGKFFSFYVRCSTLLHLPPLRLHCVGGCWDRAQDCCDHRVHRVATAAFWRTINHAGKISPGWGVGGCTPIPFHSPVKLQCTLQLSGQTHLPSFISSKNMYSVVATLALTARRSDHALGYRSHPRFCYRTEVFRQKKFNKFL